MATYSVYFITSLPNGKFTVDAVVVDEGLLNAGPTDPDPERPPGWVSHYGLKPVDSFEEALRFCLGMEYDIENPDRKPIPYGQKSRVEPDGSRVDIYLDHVRL